MRNSLSCAHDFQRHPQEVVQVRLASLALQNNVSLAYMTKLVLSTQ